MKGKSPLAALIVILPVVLFGAVLAMNWGSIRIVPEGGEDVIHLSLGFDRALRATLPALLFGTLVYGLVVGALAALVALRGRLLDLRRALADTSHDNARLQAANRALEAALPVLREKYDAAIGALGPEPPLVTEPLDDPADQVSLAALARDEAEARRQARQAARAGH